MEPIIVLVGFLGAGKTTLLKNLATSCLNQNQNPFIILNDYQNASLDAGQLLSTTGLDQITPINGSCICCSGINELRAAVNKIPARENGITFIEANGTTDACTLMEFLGVGIRESFLPPVQISVVDCRNWQQRNSHNQLEAEQIKVSSIIVLNYAKDVSIDRLEIIKNDLSNLNPTARIETWENISGVDLFGLTPASNEYQPTDHFKSHFSSCSVPLPPRISSEAIERIMNEISDDVLRVKACTKLDDDSTYTFIERTPTREINKRAFHGELVSGPTLLTVGPGSNPDEIEGIIRRLEDPKSKNEILGKPR